MDNTVTLTTCAGYKFMVNETKNAGFDSPVLPEGEDASLRSGTHSAQKMTCRYQVIDPPDEIDPAEMEKIRNAKCVICHRNWVDVLDGFDTCQECLNRM